MKTRKLTAVLLALIMAFAVLPAAAFAESIEGIAGEAAAMRKLDNAWAALDAAEADALAQGMSRTEVINAVYTAALSLNTVIVHTTTDSATNSTPTAHPLRKALFFQRAAEKPKTSKMPNPPTYF